MPRAVLMPIADKSFSSTIAQGFGLLQCFTSSRPLLGNKELSELCGLPPSTIARLTHTLCALGFLVRVDRHRKYRLGYSALTLAYPVLANMRERHLARRHMRDLTDRTFGQTSMAVLHGLDAVYVESFRPEEQWLSRPEIGTTRPALQTAIGHALLYSLEEKRFRYLMSSARERLGRAFPATSRQIQDSFNQLDRQGYCTVRGSYRPELHALAVPLTARGHDDPIAFNLSIRAYGGRHPDLDRLAPQLIELRDRTLEEMGAG